MRHNGEEEEKTRNLSLNRWLLHSTNIFPSDKTEMIRRTPFVQNLRNAIQENQGKKKEKKNEKNFNIIKNTFPPVSRITQAL